MGHSVDFEALPAPEILDWAIRSYGSAFAIATSFQKEGMVLVDMASRLGNPFRVFTIDTGRMAPETYRMIEIARERYGLHVEVVLPDADEVSRMMTMHGPNLFYGSVEARTLCCEVRKVRPLERKLREFSAWASGLRRGQAETRTLAPKAEQTGGILKLNPLVDWTSSEIDAYISRYSVPIHPLYARGYTSIGCAPCSRPVRIGEDERAGRWWWENDTKKECGIHYLPDGSERRLAS